MFDQKSSIIQRLVVCLLAPIAICRPSGEGLGTIRTFSSALSVVFIHALGREVAELMGNTSQQDLNRRDPAPLRSAA